MEQRYKRLRDVIYAIVACMDHVLASSSGGWRGVEEAPVSTAVDAPTASDSSARCYLEDEIFQFWRRAVPLSIDSAVCR